MEEGILLTKRMRAEGRSEVTVVPAAESAVRVISAKAMRTLLSNNGRTLPRCTAYHLPITSLEAVSLVNIHSSLRVVQQLRLQSFVKNELARVQH
jgi:hypothetical protein